MKSILWTSSIIDTWTMKHVFNCDDKHKGRSPYYYYLGIIPSSFDAITDGAIKLIVGLEWKCISRLFDWTKKSTEIISSKQRSL